MYMLNMYRQHRLIDESRCGRSDNRTVSGEYFFLPSMLVRLHVYSHPHRAHRTATRQAHGHRTFAFRAPGPSPNPMQSHTLPTTQTHTQTPASLFFENILTISIDSRPRWRCRPLIVLIFGIRNGFAKLIMELFVSTSFYV